MLNRILSIVLLLASAQPNVLNMGNQTLATETSNLEPLQVEEGENLLQVSPLSLELELYSSVQLQVSVNTELTDYVVEFQAMDPTTATVNAEGFVEALKIGTTQIVVRASLEGATYERIVEVSVYPIESDIVFEETAIQMTRGQSYDVKYTTSNPKIQNKDIVWNSSNPEIATVENSKIKALKFGKVTITATIGEVTASMTVSISVPLEKIEFNPSEVMIHMGNEMELPKLIYVPFDTSVDRKVDYSSSNKEILEVIDGLIIPKSIGTAEVIATVGDKKTALKVEVKARENEFGASVLQYKLVESYESRSVFGIDNALLNTNTLFALSLPVKESLDALEKGKSLDVIVQNDLFANNFKRVDQLTLPSEVMSEIKDKPLVVNLLNSAREVIATYRFNAASPFAVNLKYSIRRISNTSELGMMVDGPSYEIKFEQALFPELTTVSLPSSAIGSYPNAMHFIYALSDTNVPDKNTMLTVQSTENFEIKLSSNRYLVAFSALSDSNDRTAIMLLSLTLGSIFVIWGVLKLVKRGKRTEL